MNLFTTLLLAGAVVLGFFLLADAAIYLLANLGDRGESRRARRLAARTRAAIAADQAIERVVRDEKPSRKLSFNDYIGQLVEAAGSETSNSKVYLAMGLVALTTFVALLFAGAGLPMPLRVLIAVVVGVFLAIFRLKGQVSKRLAKLVEQFPDTLDLIVRSLRIGHPLSAALQTIGREMPAPTGPEFEIVSRQITYGKTPAEAIGALAQRAPSPDIRFFAVAVQIHHEAGGNLGEILAGLSKIIRARFQLFRKVQALTAEGRFSAYFLSAFPVVMIFAMNALQPGYYEKVADYVLFPHLVALTFFLLVVNVIAMRMMTKMEV